MGINKVARVSAYVGSPHQFVSNRIKPSRTGGAEFDAIYQHELSLLREQPAEQSTQGEPLWNVNSVGDFLTQVERSRRFVGHTRQS